jgi:hypothetical protein
MVRCRIVMVVCDEIGRQSASRSLVGPAHRLPLCRDGVEGGMSPATKIEWTRGDDGSAGRTWNPVTGCDRISPG